MVPERVRIWLRENGFGEVTATEGVSGGCINHGQRISTAFGQTLFLKTNRDTPPDMFIQEAAGLRALAVPDGPRVPKPYLAGPDFLLLEDLQPAPRSDRYWPEFGRQMGLLHNHLGSQFGFDADNYIGSTPQPNPWTGDGFVFFGQHRLLFQAVLANRDGLLTKTGLMMVESLVGQLPELIPPQPASLIHGDLWSGNALTDEQGRPALIDPAAHFGWGEAELAMTALFGAFPPVFYHAYEEVRPLVPGYRDRFPIYNLYHLLNHLNLFGRAYHGQVMAILDRFRL